MYLLFYGEDYYPSGGMSDYKGTFPTIEAGIAYHKEEQLPRHKHCSGIWAHIALKETMEVVKQFDGVVWERVSVEGRV